MIVITLITACNVLPYTNIAILCRIRRPNVHAMRIDAFEKRVAEMGMLKQQMTALHAAVSAAGRLDAPGLADGITWLHRQGCVRATCVEAELQRREICVRRDCQSRRDRR